MSQITGGEGSTVDLTCAIRLSALPMHRLPVVRLRQMCDPPAAAGVLLDRAGRPRTAATTPGFRKGQAPPNKGRTYPPEPLSVQDVLILIDGCSRTSATGLRDRALIATLWRSGLRISEALALQVRDLNYGATTLHVRHGKGDKARFVAMDPFAWAHIAPWLAARAKLPGVLAESGPVFCAIMAPLTGGPIGSAQVRVMLKRVAAQAGIQKRVHPHGLRHTHATELFDEGTDLRVIQKQLGHTSLQVTDRYVNHLSPRAQVEAIAARRSPRELEALLDDEDAEAPDAK